MSNQYKIGEFSKYMGVTPDFLKHYEQYGLIQPNISESNYRYYNFEKASDVIECVRLRNWGFSLKEIQNITQEASVEETVLGFVAFVDKKAAEEEAAAEAEEAERLAKLTPEELAAEIFSKIAELENEAKINTNDDKAN